GAAGSLLLRPGLTGAAISMGATEDRLRLRVRQVLDPARTGEGAPAMFDPELAEAVPEDAVAYFGLPGLDRGAGRLLAAVAGGAAPGLSALADRTAAEARRSGVQ